jgi:hypothetical protein
MSIVVIPGQFRGEPHPAGKLASTVLSVTVAGMADPSRFRRGKSYVLDGAVTRLEVEPGTLQATVVGSRDQPYHVVAAVQLVDRAMPGTAEALRAQITRLTPEAGEVVASCTCPDWEDPCKHAVAALLAFANELVARPELLVLWRCQPADGEPLPRQRVGARARPSERHLRIAPPPQVREPAPEPANPWVTPEWVAFLGKTPPSLPEVPREPVGIGRAMLGTIDLSGLVRGALDAMTID